MSHRRLDDLIRITRDAGWRGVGVRRHEPEAFARSGAAVVVVDAREDLSEGLAAVRALSAAVERAGAALLALTPRNDAGAIGSAYAAGATHFLPLPASDEEIVHAIRFARRYATRLGWRGLPAVGRRRGDPAPVGTDGDLIGRWAAERLAAGRAVVVAHVTLTSFDLVNSAHGRAAGDLILSEAAQRLRSASSELFGGEAVVMRCSGPEFLVAGDAARASEPDLGAGLTEVLARPFGRAVVGARLGVATSNAGEEAGALIRRAIESAAFASGNEAIEELAVAVHHAIGDDQIDILFQPQVEMAGGRIVGVEALARWEHPRLGPVGAEALFAAAERAGLSLALSDHVQKRALESAARWPDALSRLRLSVNVTAEDVGSADFIARFLDRVSQAGFPRARLTAEVTETGLIADLSQAGALLGRLREAGCRTAIDDFGTGYSNLAYLHALPLDYLKLDKALVRGVERDGRERVVARGVLWLARSLGLVTIAEGVETAAQRDLLAREGCELFQDFLCAGAVGVEELMEMVKRPPSLVPC